MSNKYFINKRKIFFLSFFNNILLLIALLFILINPPINSYDFSIYDEYPFYFWFLIIVSILSGILSSFLSLSNKNTYKYWVLGFFTEIIAISILLFLPMIRGYYIYGSEDVLSHIGYIIDIENNGYLNYNHYPALHILSFSLIKTSGISIYDITKIIPPVFSLFSILFWYILGREIFPNNKIGLSCLVIFGSLPIFSSSNSLFAPNYQANILIPLLLFGILKTNKISKTKGFNVILITFSLLFVFLHPLITLVVISILCLLIFSNKFCQKRAIKHFNNKDLGIIVAIMVIIFFSWSTYLYIFTDIFYSFFSSIVDVGITESEMSSKLDLIKSVDVDFFYLLRLASYIYGIDFLLGVTSIVCLVYIAVDYRKRKIEISNSLLFFIICFFTFFVLAIIIFSFINEFGFVRILNIAKIFALLIISSTVALINRNPSKKPELISKFIIIVIICSLVSTIFLSIFTVHISPLSKNVNQQITESDYNGMRAFFKYRDDSCNILENGISQYRYYTSQYGVSAKKRNIRYGKSEKLLPIDNFGYNKSSYLGENYYNKNYFLLNKLGEKFYEKIYPEFPYKWRFTKNDFLKLGLDSSVQKILTSGDLKIYLIR